MSDIDVDDVLVRRCSVATAALYLGRSPRWVQREIASGRLPAIDLAPPGAKRAAWAIAVRDLRAYIVRAELAAGRRRAEAQATGATGATGAKGATPPNSALSRR